MESNVIHREGSRGNLSRSSNYLRNREIWTRYHYETFLLTFFSYAIMHASRKTLSTVKPSLINVWTANTTSGHTLFDNDEEAEDFLSVLDSGFLAAYAVVRSFIPVIRIIMPFFVRNNIGSSEMDYVFIIFAIICRQ
ncbi:hypothetical protein AB6A40_005547 [Gnathostoma spinigerum]|uniref:Uncharacterized protein n=1 Tax=Gnathostoma spinigerum TaxID=75299 RepID=A0ABD6EPB7_9BILA